MQVKKEQLELDIEQQTGSRLGKENVKAVYCHPAYLTYMQNTSWKMPAWMNHKLEPRLSAEISITWYYADDTTLMAESEEELKSLLMRVERGEWKNWLKTQHQKTKIMSSSPITSGQIDGEKMEIVTDFIFLSPKITPDCDCNQEIKRHLLLDRKTITNLDRQPIKKQRHHFANKGLYTQSCDFFP